MLTDTPEDAPVAPENRKPPHHAWVAWSVLIGVVLIATLTDCLAQRRRVSQAARHSDPLRGDGRRAGLLWSKVVTPREAYASIDWQVLLMLYGLLGLGMAMQNTGTAEWLAESMVDRGASIRRSGHACRW